MIRLCQTCVWFNPDFAPDDDPKESLGLCEWPAALLPASLKMGNRERGAVCPLDGDNCPQWIDAARAARIRQAGLKAVEEALQ